MRRPLLLAVPVHAFVSRFLIAVVALFTLSATAAAQTDVIRGRVTNTEGLALPNVRVTATSIPGNVTREVRTDNRGAFQIAFPNGTGDYIMGYALIGYVFRQRQVKRLADEDVLLADASLSVIQLDTVTVVEQVQQRVGRNSQTPDVGGTERPVDPSLLPADLQGDLAALAASMPGVLLVPGVDGAADGFSVLGLDADQNSVTLNGLELGANGLPRDAAISSSLATSPYDASRGGFSGANLNIRTGSGSNLKGRGMSLVLNAPQLQWTDRAARALGSEYTNVSVGGMASGPITRNRAFYNVSYQLGRQSRENASLLETDPLGLQTAGVAADSVDRFVTILDSRGVPVLGIPARRQRISDNGSLLGSFDWSPRNSTAGHAFNVTLNGSWGRQSPVGGGATTLTSSSGDRTNWSGGLQGRHSGYLGMLLSETSAGVTMSHNQSEPYVDLPAGRVRVNSVFADGADGVQTLSFGGNQGLRSRQRTLGATAQNTLSWFDDANRHRIKLTTELRLAANEQVQASNALGTFVFNSLEDLEGGRPASFTRTLSVRERATRDATASIALGDSWRRTEDLQIQYGVRVDAARIAERPAFNPAVEAAFGRRNDEVPTPIAVSPRVGFSWTVGRTDEIEAFAGAARRPRAVVRGGIGVFTSTFSTGQLGSVLENTGLPGGVQQIVCVGPAVPIPDWTSYAGDPAMVPTTCADGSSGESPFANRAPSVTLFAPGYRPPQSIRSNLSWSGQALDGRFSTTVEGTWSLNRNRQRSVDLNFAPLARFQLDDGRPVFVEPASIVPSSGSIATRDARVADAFARVSELRSDLTSRTAQLSFRFSPVTRGPTRFRWNGAYTYSHIREQVSGFSSTAADPLEVTWAGAGQGPHQINYTLRYDFFDAVEVSWNGSFRSGSAYTPMIAGDVNGDGYSNDRAFLYDPATAPDSALADGMARLLDGASDRTRECLVRQLGSIAARNSCRGPWTSSASMNVTLDRVKFRMPQRAAVSFSLANPLGAADLMLNGSGSLRGWGQNASPDQSLFHVRGFDPATQRYRYEVNQRFGATRPQFLTLRSPVVLTMQVRLDLGPTMQRQTLEQQLAEGRRRAGERNGPNTYRSMGINGLPNPMAAILREQDSLALTAMQADSIAVMNRRYTYRTDSIWAPVARYMADLPKDYDDDLAFDRYLEARRAQVAMLKQIVPAINALLTREQKRRLSGSVTNSLDPRYLDSIRDGNALYAGSSGLLGRGFGARF